MIGGDYKNTICKNLYHAEMVLCLVSALQFNIANQKNPNSNIENALVNLILWVGGKELSHAESVLCNMKDL